jgi:hypothetical protein
VGGILEESGEDIRIVANGRSRDGFGAPRPD